MVPRAALAVGLTDVGSPRAEVELPILDRRGAGSRTPSRDDSQDSQCQDPNEKKPERRLKAASGRVNWPGFSGATYIIHAQILDRVRVKQPHQA